MAGVLMGLHSWGMKRDKDGNRIYKAVFRVLTSDTADGPFIILQTPGLPQPGDFWKYGNDADPWAWCRFEVDLKPVIDGEPNDTWLVEYTFSTEPLSHCQDYIVEDPLVKPDQISLTFRNTTEEATHDIDGRRLLNSAHEPLRGHAIEFDKSIAAVKVDQNVPFLDSDRLMAMVNTVNDDVLWGFPKRTVKLARVQADCMYTAQCQPYIHRVLEFEIDPKTWDRDVLDDATLVLQGRWSSDKREWVVANIGGKPADPKNPMHFQQAIDPLAHPRHMILNGAGLPAEVFVSTGNLFVSIQDGNINNDVSDSTFWIPLLSGDVPEPWDDVTFYATGSAVSVGGPGYYISTEDVFPTENPPGFNDKWTFVPLLINAGGYNAGLTYGRGEYVHQLTKTAAGKINVRLLPESNFLLLDIPTALVCALQN